MNLIKSRNGLTKNYIKPDENIAQSKRMILNITPMPVSSPLIHRNSRSPVHKQDKLEDSK